MVTHANLTSNCLAMQQNCGHSQDTLIASWCPLFHDMGLIGGVLLPLFIGFPSVLLSPVKFLNDPFAWLKAISDYRATCVGAPNFAYDHCVNRVTEEQKNTIDLTCLKVAKNGSEPVRAETLNRFVNAFVGCGFRMEAFLPCYGLAEVTLFASGGPAGEVPRRLCVEPSALEAGQVCATEPSFGRWLVSSGRPGEGTRVKAVDPGTKTTVPEGRVGELWVSSPSVAAGYWGHGVENNKVFGNYLASGDGPFVSTGDLGFLDGGEVYVVGRSKDLIIIRGRNIYPQDVEAAVLRVLPFLEANFCAAFAIDEKGQERLGLVIEADRRLVRMARLAYEGNGKAEDASAELAGIVGRVREAVGEEFEVRAHAIVFVRPGSFPRTSSGKVQRRACLVPKQA